MSTAEPSAIFPKLSGLIADHQRSAAALEVLIKATGDDGDLYIPRTLAADIRALIREDER